MARKISRNALSMPVGEGIILPDTLPLLPLSGSVVFPGEAAMLLVSTPASVAAVDEALRRERLLFAAGVSGEGEEPKQEELGQRVGTICSILRSARLPEGQLKVLVHGIARGRIVSLRRTKTFHLAQAEEIFDLAVPEIPGEDRDLLAEVKELLQRLGALGREVSAETESLTEPTDSARLADLIAAGIRLPQSEAQEILEILDPVRRLRRVQQLLSREFLAAETRKKVETRARSALAGGRREEFLRAQLKALQEDLYGNRITLLREALSAQQLPEAETRRLLADVDGLAALPPDSPEAVSLREYLAWVSTMPWQLTANATDAPHVDRNILDRGLLFLDEAKERLLDLLAVRRSGGSGGRTILLAGPPGTGKSSLAERFAEAAGTAFVRLSLARVRDEADLRGSARRSGHGGPGLILQAVREASVRNPVILMENIDAIPADAGGNPFAVLLDAISPESSRAFTDAYLGIPFDLSGVTFICSCSHTDPLPPWLRDRMEEVPIHSFTDSEKGIIAARFLLPRLRREIGVKTEQAVVTPEAVEAVITRYTFEAGVRQLDRLLSRICARVARLLAEHRADRVTVTPDNLVGFLGHPRYIEEKMLERDHVGIVTGLAWTAAGGEIIFIEATAMEGTGGLLLTGSLGEVMKESAEAALSWIRSNATKFGLPRDMCTRTTIHVHIPSGAMPKDGPSAGITIATALLSVLTGIAVRRELAMTGEITLRGRVLPVGGVREKVLGAVRAGMREVLIPERNLDDLQDLPPKSLAGLRVRTVRSVDEVFRTALVADPVRELRREPPGGYTGPAAGYRYARER